MAKFMLATGLVVAYSYVIEHLLGWYSGNEFERRCSSNRAFGPYAAVVLAAAAVQRRRRPVAVVQARADAAPSPVLRVDPDQRRHVARALRDRGRQPGARLPAVLVGHVHPDDLGLGVPARDARPVLAA